MAELARLRPFEKRLGRAPLSFRVHSARQEERWNILEECKDSFIGMTECAGKGGLTFGVANKNRYKYIVVWHRGMLLSDAINNGAEPVNYMTLLTVMRMQSAHTLVSRPVLIIYAINTVIILSVLMVEKSILSLWRINDCALSKSGPIPCQIIAERKCDPEVDNYSGRKFHIKQPLLGVSHGGRQPHWESNLRKFGSTGWLMYTRDCKEVKHELHTSLYIKLTLC